MSTKFAGSIFGEYEPLTGARLEAEPVKLATVDAAEVDELPPPEEPQPAADAASSPARAVMTKTCGVSRFTPSALHDADEQTMKAGRGCFARSRWGQLGSCFR